MFKKLFENRMDHRRTARDFLISIHQSGESIEDITEAVKVMREHSIKLPIPKELKDRAIRCRGYRWR